MKLAVGGVLAGLVLFFLPGNHSGPACLAAGVLLTWLMVSLGPRSIVEKVAFALGVSLIAWVAGPRAAYGQSLPGHLLGWLAAGTALAFYLHPKSE